MLAKTTVPRQRY